MNRAALSLFACALALCSSISTADDLAEIYELALQNDALLKSQEASYKANLETEKQSRAALLPQLQGNYDFTNTDSETNNNVDTAFVGDRDSDLDREGYSVSLNQAIVDMPAWFTFRSGKEFTKEAEATFAADQQDLIVRTVGAYLGVLRSISNLEASQARERAFKRQLEQTQQRFEVGLIAITDVHEAQAAYDTSRVDRIVDENNLNVAIEEVSVLTGRYHANFHLLKQDFSIAPPVPEARKDWVDFSLKNNFRLAAARYAEEGARQNSKASTSEHLPTLTGNAQYSDYTTDGDQTSFLPGDTSEFDQDEEVETYTIRLSVPIYSGGGISATRRQSAQRYLASKESRINLMRTTVTETRSTHMSVISDISRVAARAQSITSSQSALDATTAGYEVGTRNVVDVLQAQNALFAAKRDYANARYDYVRDILLLKLQAGLLGPEDVYWLNDNLEPPAAPTATQRTGSPYPEEN